MSLAKKSVKWLVTAVVVLALAFTAIFAVSASVSASAETQATLVATASATGSVGSNYPNLIQGTASTITVRYSFAMPTGFTQSDITTPEASIRPYIAGPSEAVIYPTNVVVNEAVCTFVNEETYGGGDLAIELAFDENIPVENVFGSENYWFEATYAIADNAAVGAYSYAFDTTSFTIVFKDDGSNTVVYTPTVSGTFYVCGIVQVPTQASIPVYNGDVQTIFDETENYTVENGSAKNAANNYSATLALKSPALIWQLADESFSTENQTVPYAIDPRPVTLSFSSSVYESVYGAALASITVTENNLVASTDLGTLGYAVTQNDAEVTLAQGSPVGEYLLTPTYTANTNYVVTTQTATYKITKATPVVTIGTPAEDGLAAKTYDATAVTIGTAEADILYSHTNTDPSPAISFVWYKKENGNYVETVGNAIPVAAGDYKVDVIVGATDNFFQASASRAFLINKANQVVTIEVLNKIYDAAPIALGAQVTVTKNGTGTPALVTTESTTSSTVSFSATNVGEYSFKVFIPEDANFNAYLSDTLSVAINKLSLRLIPSDIADKYYCSAPITVFNGEVTVEGFGDDSAAAFVRYLTNKSLNEAADFKNLLTYTLNNKQDVEIRNAGAYINSVVANVTAIEGDLLSNFTFTSAEAGVGVLRIANELSFFKNDGTTALENGMTVKTYNGNAVTAAKTGADIIGKTLENDGTLIVAWYQDNNGEKGDAFATGTYPVLPGTYWVGIAVAQGTNHNAVAEAYRQFVIDPANILVTFQYCLQGSDTIIPVYENPVNYHILDAVPDAPVFRSFSTTGYAYKVDDTYFYPATFTLGMGPSITLTAVYDFNVGLGDFNGDGLVNVSDLYWLRRKNAGYNFHDSLISTVADAWTNRTDFETDFYYAAALDINNSNSFNSADIVAFREALATGYSKYIITGNNVTGQEIMVVDEPVVVTTFAALKDWVLKGYPVKLGADINEEETDGTITFNGTSYIDLDGKTLTVSKFILTSEGKEVALTVKNGTIVTTIEEGTAFSVSAPYGNVKVSAVDVYSYDGSLIDLSAYHSSLHIEKNVGFYKYKKTSTVSKSEALAAAKEVVAAKQAILADNTKTAEQKATAKEEMKAIAAPVAIPVDTHLVVEEESDLIVDKVTVTQAIRPVDVVSGETVTTTFAIEVKNQDAIVVSVDAQANEVEIVNIAGETEKVEVTGAAVSNTIKTYDELVAAVQNEGASLVIGKNITINSTVILEKNVTIDLNGFELIGNDVRALWIKKGAVSLTGSGKVTASGANLDASSSVIRVGDGAANNATASLTIGANVTVSSDKCYGVTVFGKNTNDTNGFGQYLVVNGTVSVSGTAAAISGNGSSGLAATSITINDGAVVSSAYDNGIYQPQSGALLVKSGATVSGLTGLYIKSGNVTVEDGAIIAATKTAVASYEYWGNGGHPTGDGIVIDNCYYPGTNATVTLGADIEDTVTVAAQGAKKVATYWYVSDLNKLTEAVNAGGYICLGAIITVPSTINVQKDITIAMNGKNLTGNNARVLWIKSGSVELIGNGTISATGANLSSASSVIRVGDASVNNAIASLTIGAGVTVSSDVCYGVTVFGQNVADGNGFGTYLTVNGTIAVTGETGAISGNGTATWTPTCITVNDGAVISAVQSAIYQPQHGSLVIKSGASVTGATAVYIKSGNVTIEDGAVLAATKATVASYTYNGNGNNATGDAVVIDNCFYPDSNPSVVLGSNLDSTITVVAEGAKKIGNYWAVKSEQELATALNANASYIYILNDFSATGIIAVDHDVTIEGNNKKITSSAARIIDVTESNVVLTVNNLSLLSSVSLRGLNVFQTAMNTQITLNNVTIDVINYGINYENGTSDNVLIVNDSYIKAWGALNAHCNDSIIRFNDSTLYGINRTNDHTYGFSTVVIDGSSLFGAQEGENGANNCVTIDGCTIIAEVRDTHQYWISFQYAASGNTAAVVVTNTVILDAVNGNDKFYDMNLTGTNNVVVMPLTSAQIAVAQAKHYVLTNNNDGTYTITNPVSNINYFGSAYNFYKVFEDGWLENNESFTLIANITLDVDVIFAESRDAAIAVSGGSFTMNLGNYTIDGVGKIVLPAGVTCVTDSDVSIAEIFKVSEGYELVETVNGEGKYVYSISEVVVD